MKKRLLIMTLFLCFLTLGCGNELKTKNGEKLKVLKNEPMIIEYEDYNNGLVSMKVPKGWKVEVPPCGYADYTFKLYNPNDKNYMLLFALKLTGFLKSEKARAKFASLYPASVFGKLAAIEPQTTEAFYKVWNKNAKLANDISFKYEYFPLLNDFNVIENFGKVNLGGDILRGTFKNNNGELGQGLFTTSIFSSGSYFMYGYDFAPLNAYHTIMMMTPDGEFTNWQGEFDKILGSISFTDTFLQGFTREENTMVSTVKANQKIYDEISDMIMDSWQKRNTSYDIIIQKRSDATLGYERVYNSNTNEVYRAYNGFTDEYDGSVFKPASDDMYTSTISGYIEK